MIEIFQDCSIDSHNLIISWLNCIAGGLDFGYGSIFGVGLLILIGYVTLMTTKEYSYEKAMLFSSIVTMICGLIMIKLGWITTNVWYLTFVYIIIAIWQVLKERSNEEG